MRRVLFNLGLYVLAPGIYFAYRSYRMPPEAAPFDVIGLRLGGFVAIVVGLLMMITGAAFKATQRSRSVLYSRPLLRTLFAVAGVFATMASAAAGSDAPKLAGSLVGFAFLPLAAIPYLFLPDLPRWRTAFWIGFVGGGAVFFGNALHGLAAFPQPPLTEHPEAFILAAAALVALIAGAIFSPFSVLVGVVCRDLLEIEPDPQARERGPPGPPLE